MAKNKVENIALGILLTLEALGLVAVTLAASFTDISSNNLISKVLAPISYFNCALIPLLIGRAIYHINKANTRSDKALAISTGIRKGIR
jgi:hypothetical protein